MRARMISMTPPAPSWTRRAWIATALLAGAWSPLPFAGGKDVADDEETQVQQQATKAGLGPFRSTVNEHYLGIGDALDAYREQALKLCGALGTAYQKHFHEKGFSVSFPARRLTVVALKDQPSYAAFLGQPVGEEVGGHYDLDTNRLVIFDFRPGGNLPAGVARERINTFTLIHEAAHQLTFNTGLLDRRADVPVALGEGLAMYAELWRPDGRTVLGLINRPRLQVLVDRAKANESELWIPLARLLTEDALFTSPETQQLAYAEAWVLVHYLIKTPATLPKFRAYLDLIRPRHDATHRLNDAREKLGDLDRLNTALRKHATRLIREG